MITQEELLEITEETEENKNFKLATVVDLFENDTAKIMFDGEDIASEKQYAYLSCYAPKVEDRVLLGAMGGTYIILGKVNYDESPDVEEEVDRYLFDLKKVIMQKGLKVTLGTETDTLTVNNGATIVGNVGVNGSVTTTGLSATGGITGASLNVNGEVKGSNLDVSGQVKGDTLSIAKAITVAGLTSSGNIQVNGQFLHKGNALSFFNSSIMSRQSVSRNQGTPTVNNLQTTLNTLITALQNYGLIYGS